MPFLSPPSALIHGTGALPRIERIVLTTALLTVTLGAWIWMLHMDGQMDRMMRGTGLATWMPPGISGLWGGYDFWMLFVMWGVMMVAMMTPSALPTIKMYWTVSRKHPGVTQPRWCWTLFLAGYLAAWGLFSAGITVAQWPLHYWGWLDPMMDSQSLLLSGTLMIIAGLYQWTPWKDACLTLCRSPLQFLMARWRNGALGSWRMGLENGIFCVGCCWALMLVLFALGLMNMLWVAAITLFVLLEKFLPAPSYWFRNTTGLLFASVGGYFLLQAADLV